MATKEDYDYHNHTKTRGAYAVEPEVVDAAARMVARRGKQLKIDPKDTQRLLKMLGLIHFENRRYLRGAKNTSSEVYEREDGEPYKLSEGEW